MFQSIKESIKYAKETMNKTRFQYNYIAVPCVALFAILFVFVAFILVLLKSRVWTIIGIVMFSLAIVSGIVLVCFIPYVRKCDIKAEIKRLDEFFKKELLKKPELEYVLPRKDTGGVVSLTFDKEGIQIADISYSYSGFEYALYTSNYMNRVSLIVVFKRTDEGDNEDGEQRGVIEFSLPLDINLLSIMEMFDMELINPDVFRFIKENQEIAVKQILKYGKIQNDYNNAK